MIKKLLAIKIIGALLVSLQTPYANAAGAQNIRLNQRQGSTTRGNTADTGFPTLVSPSAFAGMGLNSTRLTRQSAAFNAAVVAAPTGAVSTQTDGTVMVTRTDTQVTNVQGGDGNDILVIQRDETTIVAGDGQATVVQGKSVAVVSKEAGAPAGDGTATNNNGETVAQTGGAAVTAAQAPFTNVVGGNAPSHGALLVAYNNAAVAPNGSFVAGAKTGRYLVGVAAAADEGANGDADGTNNDGAPRRVLVVNRDFAIEAPAGNGTPEVESAPVNTSNANNGSATAGDIFRNIAAFAVAGGVGFGVGAVIAGGFLTFSAIALGLGAGTVAAAATNFRRQYNFVSAEGNEVPDHVYRSALRYQNMIDSNAAMYMSRDFPAPAEFVSDKDRGRAGDQLAQLKAEYPALKFMSALRFHRNFSSYERMKVSDRTWAEYNTHKQQRDELLASITEFALGDKWFSTWTREDAEVESQIAEKERHMAAVEAANPGIGRPIRRWLAKYAFAAPEDKIAEYVNARQSITGTASWTTSNWADSNSGPVLFDHVGSIEASFQSSPITNAQRQAAEQEGTRNEASGAIMEQLKEEYPLINRMWRIRFAQAVLALMSVFFGAPAIQEAPAQEAETETASNETPNNGSRGMMIFWGTLVGLAGLAFGVNFVAGMSVYGPVAAITAILVTGAWVAGGAVVGAVAGWIMSKSDNDNASGGAPHDI